MEIGFEYDFYPDVIEGAGESELISGNTACNSGRTEYLLLERGDEMRTFKIVFENHNSAPFTQVLVVDELLAVGREGHFYLYNMRERERLQALSLCGYFGHIYANGEGLVVADAEGLYQISKKGSITWHTANLGIDGVIVDASSPTTITGQGEWDPPGGWKSFTLDRSTGKHC